MRQKRTSPDTAKLPLASLPLSSYQNRIITAVLLLLAMILMGTLGYYILEEEWTLLDALYMTMITLTTVGYGETHTLSPNGRIFTIVLLVFSMTTLGYAISTIASFVIEGQLNTLIRGRKMDIKIANLQNHIILCGGGVLANILPGNFTKPVLPLSL